MTDAPQSGDLFFDGLQQDLPAIDQLARDLYTQFQVGQARGLRFDEAMHALALVQGTLLAGGHPRPARREGTARTVMDAALLYAARQEQLGRDDLMRAAVAGHA